MQATRPTQSGFSLVELMIAMVIGLAAVIIMMQMLLNSDTAKRVTVGGNDAQITGTIALFNLERDIRSAGYGINSDKLLGCTLGIKPGDSPDTVLIPLAPVTINPDDTLVPKGDPNTDRLLLVYAKGGESSDGDPLITTSTDSTYQVTTPTNFREGDRIILQGEARADPCELTLDTVRGVGGVGLALEKGTTGRPPGSIVYNMGEFVVRAYAVRGGKLTVCEYLRNNCAKAASLTDEDIWVPVASNVVALLAQYGRDLDNTGQAMTGKINSYSRKTPEAVAEDEKLKAQCVWARTLGVRVGLVARGTAYDKSLSAEEKAKKGEDMLKPPTWSGASEIDFDLSDSIDSPNPDEWRLYRYKAFEISVPLRNMIWHGGDAC